MDFQSHLKRLLGLETVNYKYNLPKQVLFHEAIRSDRGRIRADGPDDEQKAYPTKLGIDGPLVYYSEPSCTGRPVQDTFAVGWPEVDDKVWWKNDFQIEGGAPVVEVSDYPLEQAGEMVRAEFLEIVFPPDLVIDLGPADREGVLDGARVAARVI